MTSADRVPRAWTVQLQDDYVALQRCFQRLEGLSAWSPRQKASKPTVSHWPEVLENRLAVVLGEPGAGKTTELQALANDRKAIGGRTFLYCELLALEGRLARYESEPFSVPDGPLCLLLDSLDEALNHGPGPVQQALISLGRFVDQHSLHGRLSLVVTCRRQNYYNNGGALLRNLGLGDPAVYLLLPLDAADQHTMQVELGLDHPLEKYGELEYPVWFLAARTDGIVIAGRSAAERYHALIEKRLERDRATPRLPTSLLEPARLWTGLEQVAAVVAVTGRTLIGIPSSSHALHLQIAYALPGWKHNELEALLGCSLFKSETDGGHCCFCDQAHLEYLAGRYFAHALDTGRTTLDQLRPLFCHQDEDGPVLRPRLVQVLLWMADLVQESTLPSLQEELERVEPALLFEKRRLAPRQPKDLATVLRAIDRQPLPPLWSMPGVDQLRFKLPELVHILSDRRLEAQARALVERRQLQEPALLMELLPALVAVDRRHLDLVETLARQSHGSKLLFFKLLDLLYESDVGRKLATDLILPEPVAAEEPYRWQYEQLRLARLLHPGLPDRHWWEVAGGLGPSKERNWLVVQARCMAQDHPEIPFGSIFEGAGPAEMLQVLGYFRDLISTWPDLRLSKSQLPADYIVQPAIKALLASPAERLLEMEPQARPFLAHALLGGAFEANWHSTADDACRGLLVAAYVRHVVEDGKIGARAWQQPAGWRIVLAAADCAAARLTTPDEFAFLRQLLAQAEAQQRQECDQLIVPAVRNVTAASSVAQTQQRPWFAEAPRWLLDLLVRWRHHWRTLHPITRWQATWTPDVLDRLSEHSAWLFASHACSRTVDKRVLAAMAGSVNPGIRKALKQALLVEFDQEWVDLGFPSRTRMGDEFVSYGVITNPGTVLSVSCELLAVHKRLAQILLEVLTEAPRLPGRLTTMAVSSLVRAKAEVLADTARRLQARDRGNAALWRLWAMAEPDAALEFLGQLEGEADPPLARGVRTVLDSLGYRNSEPDALLGRLAQASWMPTALLAFLSEPTLRLFGYSMRSEIAKLSTEAAAQGLRFVAKLVEPSGCLRNELRSVRDNIASRPILLNALLPLLRSEQKSRVQDSLPATYTLNGKELWPESQLGVGSQGMVVRVLDRMSRRYALKIIALNHQARARVSREIEALQKVQSRLLPKLIDSEVKEQQALLLLEWVDGTPLNAIRVEQIDTRLVQCLLAQVGKALLHLAIDGFAHRDVKPDNILLRRNENGDGEPEFCLLDLGLALQEGGGRVSLSRVGTDGFYPPDHVSYEPANPATEGRDVFGLGATAVWLGLRSEEQRAAYTAAWQEAARSGEIPGADMLARFARQLEPLVGAEHSSLLARMIGPASGRPSLKDVVGSCSSAARTSTGDAA